MTVPRILPLSLLFLLSVSCSLGQKGDLYQTVDALISESIPLWTAGQLHERASNENILILDARERSEYDVSHLHGAVWVGYDDFTLSRIPKVTSSDTLVVYCSVGYRSEKIGEKLEKAGFKHIVNLYGGIFDWVNHGYPVYDAAGQTSNIHGYDASWSKFLEKGNIQLK